MKQQKVANLNAFLKDGPKLEGKIYSGMNFKIIYDDSREISKYLDPESIQIIVTSPPYGDLRDYGKEGQIGNDQEYEEYLDALDSVWKECFNVLKSSGTLWLNIGHQMIKGNLRYIGADEYFHLTKIGFKLRKIFYWYKRNYASGYNKTNLLQNFEPVYCFTKDPVQAKLYEKQAIFNDFENNQKPIFALNSWLLIRKGGSLKKEQNNPHPASYPDELVERVISIASDPNDIVMDPFLGSGTTTKIARDMKRVGIGFEINENFYPLNQCRMELNDDYSSIQGWIKKYDQSRKLGHETQKMKNI
jgi:DNA modification methylase